MKKVWGGGISEIWDILSQAYSYTKNDMLKEALLEYFYYPQRDVLEENYKKNRSLFRISRRLYGYDLEKRESENKCIILWAANDVLYYLKDDEIRQQDFSFRCTPNEERKVLYSNMVPENLPSYNKFPFILCYDEESFECFMQCSSFFGILENCEVILVGEGLEEYIWQGGKIEFEVVVGYDGNRFIGRIEEGLRAVSKDKTQMSFSEKRVSFGSLYNGHTFYVIRVKPINSSLGPIVLWTLIQLKEAEKRGYIPVVDYSNFENIFLEEDEVGIINPWEYYFEQPTQFGLSVIYHAKNVVLGTADAYHSMEDFTALVEQPEVLKEYSRIFDKYIHISKRVEKKIIGIYENLFQKSWKVLGVVYRGTDYRNRPIPGEHRQPSMAELIQKAKELMEKWGCDHLFLSTEDKGAVEKFQQVFGERMIFVEKERYDSSIVHTQTYRFQREFDAYLKGEEYLAEIYILSKCNCLLSGRCGILSVALPLNNGKYEEKYIYDLGFHTVEEYM